MNDPDYHGFSQITPDIYLGPQYYRVGKARLIELGIRYSVNMQIEFDCVAAGLALENHCYLPTEDDEAPTFEHLRSGVEFMERAIAQGGKVYVHCAAGVGRSPTMVAAFFMNQGMSLVESLELIRASRPIIHPSIEQLDLLRKLEGRLRAGA